MSRLVCIVKTEWFYRHLYAYQFFRIFSSIVYLEFIIIRTPTKARHTVDTIVQPYRL